MVKEAEENAEADKARKEEADLINEANQLIFQTNKALNDLKNVDPTEKENAEKLVKDLEKALESKNIADIREKKEALEKVAQDIAVKAYQQTQEGQGAQGQSSDKKDDNTVDADFSDVQ